MQGLFGEQQHGGLFGERSPKKTEEENGKPTYFRIFSNLVFSN